MLFTAAAVGAAPPAPSQPPQALRLLDVPYLPQSEVLCGGAAIAMVMRFFGATNIYAETFSDLVDREAEGIRGADLLAALRTRGWTAESFRGDSGFVQSHLAAGRPVVALILDRPGRFHYVVVVGWAGGRVIVHDPARAPFRLIEERAFTTAWSASDFWTLVTTPPASAVPVKIPPVGETASSAAPAGAPTSIPDGAVLPTPRATAQAFSCAPMVDEGVRLAGLGDLDGGQRLLEAAASACPASAAPRRELAGIHALRNEWREAAGDARRAIALDASDALAARILATALFLEGDADAALEAWNRLGQPVIDLVNVTGLEHTRYRVATRAMGLRPQALLTRPSLQAARRRLADLPAAQTTRVRYRPGENGRAQVDAVVMERPRFPTAIVPLVAIGVRAAADRELALSMANSTGGGELWTASWRWWEHRPRVAGRFAAPGPFGALWRVEGFSERQSYATSDASLTTPVVLEARRRAAVQVARWTERGIRWDVEAGLDSWGANSRALSLGAGAEHRSQDDRVTLRAEAAGWFGGVQTWTTRAAADWRSSVAQEGQVWMARAGADLADAAAPLALWSGAGTGHGRDVLLRAHPLLRDGIIDGGTFGRSLLHAGAEARRWLRSGSKPLRVAPAVFLDAARARRGMPGSDSRLHVDAGVGLRVALPGSGVVRIDYARGLRDGSSAVSIGWTR